MNIESTLELFRLLQNTNYGAIDDDEDEDDEDNEDENSSESIKSIKPKIFTIKNTELILTNNTYDINCSYKYNGKQTNLRDCSICKSDDKKEKCIMLKFCNHTYHQHCIDQWFEKKQTCPMCRKNYDVKSEWSTSKASIEQLKKIPSFKYIRKL